MQVQVDIAFEQLVRIVKTLPDTQWARLKKAVEENQSAPTQEIEDLKALLLSAPTFSQEQLDAVAEARKAINEWRTA